MAKKESDGQSGGVNISGKGNVSIGGDVVGRDKITTTTTTTGISAAELGKLFDQLYTEIEARPNTSPANKADLKAEVKDVQSVVTQAVAKKEKVDEDFLARHFRNIARMAPDILDVFVATLGNPLAGIGVAVKKIAEKAKESQ